MACDLACQVFACADEIIPCDAHRCLIAVFESLDEFAVTELGIEGIVSGFGVVEYHGAGMHGKIPPAADLIILLDQVEYGVDGCARIDFITMLESVVGAEVTHMQSVILLCHHGDAEEENDAR